MKVHVLTPCSRREHLETVRASVELAAERMGRPGVVLRHHILFDDKREHVGGWGLRNQMLNEFTDGWVWLVDDTTAHPDILARFAQALEEQPDMLMFLVAQTRPAGWDPGCADPELLGHGSKLPAGGCAFDTAQAIVRRDVIGDYRDPAKNLEIERPGKPANEVLWGLLGEAEPTFGPVAAYIRLLDPPKPHGRLGFVWLIKFRAKGCPAYVDLSVTPRS